MNEDEIEKHIKFLRKYYDNCIICGGRSFHINEKYGRKILYNSINEDESLNITVDHVPFLIINCNKCGFLYDHALNIVNGNNKKREEKDRFKQSGDR